MSQQFPLLDREHIARLLRGAISTKSQETGLRYTAYQLADLNIVNIQPVFFFKCAHPADEDYPAEIIDPDCEGLVYLEDDQASNMGSYRCPCCGRIIEYPAIHKELFQTSVVHRDETGIVAHIVALLHSLPQVNTVIQLDNQPVNQSDSQLLQINLKNGAKLTGWITRRQQKASHRSATFEAQLYFPTYPSVDQAVQSTDTLRHFSLIDLLSHDQVWFSERFQEAIEIPVIQHHNRDDLQQIQVALLDAFPSYSTLAQMVRIQLNRPLDTLALGNNLEEVIFKLISRAEQEGWLTTLTEAAQQANPANHRLQSAVESNK